MPDTICASDWDLCPCLPSSTFSCVLSTACSTLPRRAWVTALRLHARRTRGVGLSARAWRVWLRTANGLTVRRIAAVCMAMVRGDVQAKFLLKYMGRPFGPCRGVDNIDAPFN